MAADRCPLCEIVAGRQPKEIVYADASVVAFLCEPPATEGHLLVVPRAHRRDIWSIPRNEATAAMSAAHLLAGVIREALGATGVNLRQNNGGRAGQDVFHFHLHVVPRYEDDTVLPGCVWGEPPWVAPPDGAEARRRAADAIRAGVAAGTA